MSNESREREESALEARGWRELARSWPRALVADGRGEGLARWWCSMQEQARGRGEPPLAHCEPWPGLLAVLSDARRARRLQRGLEGAEATLASEEAGLRAAAATRPEASAARISRLLVVTGDGSPRFYRDVQKLQERYATRLAVLMLECDEFELGEAVFGQGRRARAVLLDHKQAVVGLLAVLDDAVERLRSGRPLAGGIESTS